MDTMLSLALLERVESKDLGPRAALNRAEGRVKETAPRARGGKGHKRTFAIPGKGKLDPDHPRTEADEENGLLRGGRYDSLVVAWEATEVLRAEVDSLAKLGICRPSALRWLGVVESFARDPGSVDMPWERETRTGTAMESESIHSSAAEFYREENGMVLPRRKRRQGVYSRLSGAMYGSHLTVCCNDDGEVVAVLTSPEGDYQPSPGKPAPEPAKPMQAEPMNRLEARTDTAPARPRDRFATPLPAYTGPTVGQVCGQVEASQARAHAASDAVLIARVAAGKIAPDEAMAIQAEYQELVS